MSHTTQWKTAGLVALAVGTFAVVRWVPWRTSGAGEMQGALVLAPQAEPSSLETPRDEALSNQREAVSGSEPVAAANVVLEAVHPTASRLFGRVLDTEDQPIERAAVACWAGGAPVGPPESSTSSDAEGRFVLEHVGETVYVQANAEGFLTVQAVSGKLAAGSTIGDLVLRLARPTTQRVRVLSPEGTPVAGATVELELVRSLGTEAITRGEDLFHVRAAGPAHTATSGPDGIAVFDGIAAVAQHLSVRHPDFEPYEGRATPSPTQGITEVVLRHGERIAGRVWAPDGLPVADAAVALRTGIIIGRARTDKDGRFSIEKVHVEPGAWLSVLAKDYAVEVHEPLPRDISDRESLEIHLEPSHTLAGMVQDLDGRPIGDLVVEIEGDRLIEGEVSRPLWRMPTWEALLATADGHTDAEGRFRFDRLHAGSFRIAVAWEDGVQHRQFFEARSGSEDLVLVLDPARIDDVTFEGRVRDAITGAAIERFSILIGGRTPEGVEYNGPRVEFEDAEGRYEIGGVRPMELILFVRAPGYRDGAGTGLKPYPSGRHHEDVLLSPVRSLRLRVVDPYGQPVPSTVIAADAQGNSIWIPVGRGVMTESLETDANGEVLLQNLPATIVRVNAWPAARSTWPKDAQQFWEITFDLSRPNEGVQELVIQPPR